jgi:putative hydrolase of the HAD superfamily
MTTMHLEALMLDFGDTLVLTDKWDYDKCLARLLASLHANNLIPKTNYNQFKHVYFEVRDQMYQQTEENFEEVDFRVRISETLKKLNPIQNYKSKAIVDAAEAFIDAFLEDLRVEAFLQPLLEKLKSLYKLAIVSNFAYAPGLHRILNHFNLKQFFDTIIISGEFGFRKPNPKIFEEAVRKLNVKSENSVFIGDSLKADIYGAHKVGIKTILVENHGLRKNPYAVAGELDPYPAEPEFRIQNLSELPNILKLVK